MRLILHCAIAAIKKGFCLLDEKILISKEVLEDYFGEHNLDCTGEQINRYYQAFQYLL